MKNIARHRFANGWAVLIVGLVGVGLLVLWGVHRWKGAPSAPAPELVALARTNLEHRSLGWFQKGQTNAFTGILLDYYPGGRLMSRSVVSNGLLNGLSEGWYTNGQLQVRETYRTNCSDGLRTRWYASGQKLSEVTVVHGQMSGVYRRWYENGSLAEEIPMKDGNINGDGRAYYPSGFLKATVKYIAGKAVEQKTWPDGEQKGG